ncbi:hypothetical protein TanjilG_12518 [Lupinus angustifolius]|uniref:WHIM1 domain-containing protein n=1 Tax=Lupinus angustifolius TaxID=3871 RepID=A0A4P1QYJ2_LUPAN|nr:hypothetical protein TanjilG_12518 [Lupinus angustifolius]
MHSVEEQRRCGEENLVNAEILKLRNRWELASVLNFLEVFSPILGKDLKASAEEIEIGLVKPDVSLAKLHIQLLKGIPPVNRTLNDPDKWVTVLCKKLVTWWQWVAVGKIPLMPSKGEEISKYKELDSSDRLLLLKALCEVRADQHDAVSYINDALKEGTHITSIRKEALGRDGTGTSYWYDANAKCQSHRLYRGRITKRKVSPGSDQDRNKGLEVKSDGEDVSSDSGSEGGMLQISDTDGDDSGYEIENPGEIEYHVDSSEEDNNADDSEQGNPETHSSNAVSYHPKGSRCSMRLAGVSSHCILESRGLTSKQRLRQRPTPNSAIDSVVVSDSDDEAAQEGKAGLPEST